MPTEQAVELAVPFELWQIGGSSVHADVVNSTLGKLPLAERQAGGASYGEIIASAAQGCDNFAEQLEGLS